MKDGMLAVKVVMFGIAIVIGFAKSATRAARRQVNEQRLYQQTNKSRSENREDIFRQYSLHAEADKQQQSQKRPDAKPDTPPTDVEDHDGWLMVGENGDLIAISEDEAAIGPLTEDEAAEIERLGHRGFIEERRRKRAENN